MRFCLKAMFLFTVLGLSLFVKADGNTTAKADGNGFLSSCQTAINIIEGTNSGTDGYIDAGRCLGYLQGMSNMNLFYRASLDKGQVHFCIPEEVTSLQLARVVVKKLKDSPETLHKHEGALVWEALFLAFPCD